MQHVLVIFSGGQDSTTCLGWALNRYPKVTAISFLYGQKHKIEIQQAQKICSILNVEQQIIDVSFFGKMVNSALTDDTADLNSPHQDHQNLPASFVPNRNAFFLVLAHAAAQTLMADALIAGFCETDFSGYPDCREDFIQSIEKSLSLGSETSIPIITPLMHLSKAETFLMAEQESILDLIIHESHTCYQGDTTLHPWGKGCGDCPACKLRFKGFTEYQQNLLNN